MSSDDSDASDSSGTVGCSVGKGCSCGKDGSTSITKGDLGGNGNSYSCGEGDSRGMALTSGHGIVSA